MVPQWKDVIVYAPVTDKPSLLDKLREVIDSLGSGESVEVCRTVKELGRRLRQPRGRPGIVVLLAVSREDLLDLLSMASLLEDFRIVLVFPDREADTVTREYSLRPRFLTFSDSSFGDIGAVLKKMRNGAQL